MLLQWVRGRCRLRECRRISRGRSRIEYTPVLSMYGGIVVEVWGIKFCLRYP